MSNRRNTWFYALLIAMTSAAAALVIASRLGLCAGVVRADRCGAADEQRAHHGAPDGEHVSRRREDA